MTRAEAEPLLSLTGMSKSYGGVRALSEADFAARAGSIHAVLGENGAGKSTLIKIVAVFQELSVIPDLSVADNISITDPPRRFGLIDHRAQRRRAEELLARVGCEDINPIARVGSLPLSRRQMVEIAKALGRRPKLLILDEATSALTAADVERVYAILHKLRAEGMAVLYISHRMNEIEELADTVSVFRNGRHVRTFAQGQASGAEVVQMMVGRDVSSVYPPKPRRSARPAPALEVDGLSWAGRLAEISFTAGRGEIVGLGGLDGQGQRELLLALFGVLGGVEGRVAVEGRPVRLTSPRAATRAGVGIALIPEDRKTEGLVLPMSVGANISLTSLGSVTRGVVIDRAAEAARVAEMVGKLKIKIGDVGDPVATLSGGNQQKVVIAKWLLTGARILLLNDPTRGIDVGTKQEIYRLLRGLADAGATILLYSTDYEELIGCCDRVLILYAGRIVRVLEGEDISETNIVAGAFNLPAGDLPAGILPAGGAEARSA
ncbi:MAG: sugar ABC transporter ATP-binding protein [Rhodobacteraceae bacterium]|nr:sugar ABC transporter ATP-binding protein [Paracoccaceae bacterium]